MKYSKRAWQKAKKSAPRSQLLFFNLIKKQGYSRSCKTCGISGSLVALQVGHQHRDLGRCLSNTHLQCDRCNKIQGITNFISNQLKIISPLYQKNIKINQNNFKQIILAIQEGALSYDSFKQKNSLLRGGFFLRRTLKAILYKGCANARKNSQKKEKRKNKLCYKSMTYKLISVKG